MRCNLIWIASYKVIQCDSCRCWLLDDVAIAFVVNIYLYRFLGMFLFAFK